MLARRIASSWIGPSYWLITKSGKIISKTSVEHVTRDDYLQTDKKAEIEAFNCRLEESLDNANFMIDGEGEFDSMYLDDIDDNVNPGVVRGDEEEYDTTPSAEDYRDMHTNERTEDDDKEAIDKYLNVELIMNMGTNDK
jgi:hypothetical protein